MSGVKLCGLFCGSDKKVFTRLRDGKHIESYYILISNGADFYKIRSETDKSKDFVFGDQVEVPVVPNVYNGNIYWNYEE